MKIILIENADKWSGACYKVMLLARELMKIDYEVIVVTKPNTIVTDMFAKANLNLYPCKILNDADIFAFFKLRKLFIKFKPDIVEIFNQKAYWLGSILCRMMKIKCVINRNIDWLPKHKKLLSFLLRHFAYRVVAVSEFVRDIVHKDLNYPYEHIKVIYSCKEMDILKNNDGKSGLRDEFGLLDDDIIFTYVGRLASEKGLTTLISAFAGVVKQNPKAKLFIVGDGSDKFIDTLSLMINEEKLLQCVYMTGFRFDVLNVLNATDIFVHPSIYEALSQSIIEAMALGKLVIATNTGGITEYLRDNINGFIVEPGNASALRAKMLYVLENRFELEHIKEQAKQDVIEKFDKKNFINDYINFYDNLIS